MKKKISDQRPTGTLDCFCPMIAGDDAPPQSAVICWW